MRDNRAPTRYSNWQESSRSSSESEDEDKESEGEENQLELEKENMEKKQAAMQTTIEELREQIQQFNVRVEWVFHMIAQISSLSRIQN